METETQNDLGNVVVGLLEDLTSRNDITHARSELKDQLKWNVLLDERRETAMGGQKIVEKAILEGIVADSQGNLLAQALESSFSIVRMEVILAEESNQAIALTNSAKHAQLLW